MSKRTSTKQPYRRRLSIGQKELMSADLVWIGLKHIYIVGVAVAREISKDVILFPIL